MGEDQMAANLPERAAVEGQDLYKGEYRLYDTDRPIFEASGVGMLAESNGVHNDVMIDVEIEPNAGMAIIRRTASDGTTKLSAVGYITNVRGEEGRTAALTVIDVTPGLKYTVGRVPLSPEEIASRPGLNPIEKQEQLERMQANPAAIDGSELIGRDFSPVVSRRAFTFEIQPDGAVRIESEASQYPINVKGNEHAPDEEAGEVGTVAMQGARGTVAGVGAQPMLIDDVPGDNEHLSRIQQQQASVEAVPLRTRIAEYEEDLVKLVEGLSDDDKGWLESYTSSTIAKRAVQDEARKEKDPNEQYNLGRQSEQLGQAAGRAKLELSPNAAKIASEYLVLAVDIDDLKEKLAQHQQRKVS